MLSLFWSFLGFVITMGIIVTIHEWGHYQAAKWFNVKILKFSIGFGKPIWSRKGKETEFVIAQIPLGGYVKFADEREEPVAQGDLARAFNRQSVYKKIAIVAAGPVVNLIFAWLAFTLMFMVGVSGYKPILGEVNQASPVADAIKTSGYELGSENWIVEQINDKEVLSWQGVYQQLLQALANGEHGVDIYLVNTAQQTIILNGVSLDAIDINDRGQDWLEILGLNPAKPKIPAVLGEVLPDSPALKAGLQTGDEIVRINQIEINSWQDFVKVVQSNPGADVTVTYRRDQAEFETVVSLLSETVSSGENVGKMGVGVKVDEQQLQAFQTTVKYGFIDASDKALERSAELIGMSLVMLKRMLIGEVSTDNLSGPISIAQFSGQALQTGIIAFLSLLGLLSLSIGILNLLPIPVLDGGHLLFYFIEIIKGSPVSEQTMMAGQYIGLLLLVGLTFLALFNDVLRIFHG